MFLLLKIFQNRTYVNYTVCVVCILTDSVEDGEKVIQTALDAFGQIGAFIYF